MSTVTIVIPTFNEELNIRSSYERVKSVFEKDIPNHNFQILYIDNDSKDQSRKLIRELCEQDRKSVV